MSASKKNVAKLWLRSNAAQSPFKLPYPESNQAFLRLLGDLVECGVEPSTVPATASRRFTDLEVRTAIFYFKATYSEEEILRCRVQFRSSTPFDIRLMALRRLAVKILKGHGLHRSRCSVAGHRTAINIHGYDDHRKLVNVIGDQARIAISAMLSQAGIMEGAGEIARITFDGVPTNSTHGRYTINCPDCLMVYASVGCLKVK